MIEQRFNAIVNLGLIDNLDYKTFIVKLRSVIESLDKRRRLSDLSLKLLDGKGLERVANIILN